MKKLLATLTPCIIICLLISSCSSNVSIVKRHYRGGYYVNYVKKTPSVTPVANAKTTPHKRVVVTALPTPQIQADTKEAETFNLNTTPVPVSTTAVSENANHKNLKSVTKQLTAPLRNIAKAPTTEVKQSLSEGAVGSAGYDDAAGAALSLLWIVIVIILILWLIGILAGGWGLGGLLNLLLVIALILLILWLLRIA